MTDIEVNESKIRQQTEQLIELLREHHPEQECEPEGLKLPQPPPAPQPVKSANLSQALPVKSETDFLREKLAVLEFVADKHDLEVSDIVSRDQSRSIVQARNEAFKIFRDMKWSWARIGRIMGRDHTTVMSGAYRHTHGMSKRQIKYARQQAAS